MDKEVAAEKSKESRAKAKTNNRPRSAKSGEGLASISSRTITTTTTAIRKEGSRFSQTTTLDDSPKVKSVSYSTDDISKAENVIDILSPSPRPAALDTDPQASTSQLTKARTVDSPAVNTPARGPKRERPLRDFRISVISEEHGSMAFMTVADVIPPTARSEPHVFDFAGLALLCAVVRSQIPSRHGDGELTYRGEQVLAIRDDIVLRYAIKEAYYGDQGVLKLFVGVAGDETVQSE